MCQITAPGTSDVLGLQTHSHIHAALVLDWYIYTFDKGHHTHTPDEGQRIRSRAGTATTTVPVCVQYRHSLRYTKAMRTASATQKHACRPPTLNKHPLPTAAHKPPHRRLRSLHPFHHPRVLYPVAAPRPQLFRLFMICSAHRSQPSVPNSPVPLPPRACPPRHRTAAPALNKKALHAPLQSLTLLSYRRCRP